MHIPPDMKEDIDYQMAIDYKDDPMLVSYGNPYNPFTDFKGWWRYDYFVIGWDTCGLLARNVAPSPNESDLQQHIDTVDAMKQIVLKYPRIFRIVKKSDYENPRTLKKIQGPYGGSN